MITAVDVLKTEDAKLNFLKGLIRVAKCDNVIKESEKAFFYEAAGLLNTGNEVICEIDKLWTCNDISVSFGTSEEKMFLIIQLVQLCWIDGEYVEAEKIEIRKIAEELGISIEAVKTVEEWVKEGVDWSKRGEKFLKLK